MPHPKPPADDPPRRERWAALFEQSDTPIFVLYRSRRIRYVNAAWESLTKVRAADAIGRACVRSGRIDPIFRALAPPSEARSGAIVRVRRAAPLAKGGPPWWDLTFLPLATGDTVNGYIGTVRIVQPVAPIPPRKMPAVVGAARENQAARFSFDLFAGESAESRRIGEQLRLAANALVPVWIVGEPGSGKETLARVVHHNSPAREKSFVACDCRGLQPYLIDSILFGIGGLATAGRVGTLLLKSPEALPRDAQQRIVDWLHIAPMPPRIICASNRSVVDAVRSGRLLSEFHSEFSTLQLELPPLRNRKDELSRIVERMGFQTSAESAAILQAYAWPGNLHELHETLAEAAARAGEGPIAPAHLPRYLRDRAMIAANPAAPKDRALNLDDILAAVEKRMIETALRRAKGNQTAAAALLGVVRARLGRRIEALKIET